MAALGSCGYVLHVSFFFLLNKIHINVSSTQR